jgi:hypothetical protein
MSLAPRNSRSPWLARSLWVALLLAMSGAALSVSWASETIPGLTVQQRELSALDVPEQLPVASVSQRPWSRPCAAPLPPDVLACVDGFAVDRAAFDRARVDAPAEVSNRALVDALIQAEVLAAQALRAGFWGEWLVDPFRAALMRRLLVQRFERDFGPEKVRDADIERAFIRAPIRVRYAHERHWSVIDAQFLCCTGDWHGCEVDPKVQRCHEANYPQAEALAAELAADPPQSAIEFEGRVLAARPRFPNASVQNVGFYYDLEKSYDQQGEYDKMLESWTTAVIALKVGEISPPIRSAYGWHIVRINEITPKITGTTKDPDVRADIAQGILNGVRERDVQIYITDLMRSRNVGLLYDNVLY